MCEKVRLKREREKRHGREREEGNRIQEESTDPEKILEWSYFIHLLASTPTSKLITVT